MCTKDAGPCPGVAPRSQWSGESFFRPPPDVFEGVSRIAFDVRLPVAVPEPEASAFLTAVRHLAARGALWWGTAGATDLYALPTRDTGAQGDRGADGHARQRARVKVLDGRSGHHDGRVVTVRRAPDPDQGVGGADAAAEDEGVSGARRLASAPSTRRRARLQAATRERRGRCRRVGSGRHGAPLLGSGPQVPAASVSRRQRLPLHADGRRRGGDGPRHAADVQHASCARRAHQRSASTEVRR